MSHAESAARAHRNSAGRTTSHEGCATRTGALSLVLAAALLGGTGCFYSYRPLEYDYMHGSEDVEGKVVRVQRGSFVRDMKVKRLEGPWITGEIADDEGAPHMVTMDLRTMPELQVRQVSKGAKAGLITAGAVTVAGALVGGIAASVAKIGSYRP